MRINLTAKQINEWAESKGWNADLEPTIESLAKQGMNFHAEISEAWEELRAGRGINEIYENPDEREHAGKPEGFPIELADLVIRVLHTCAFYGIDLESAITIKMEYNQTRPFRHGGKKA